MILNQVFSPAEIALGNTLISAGHLAETAKVMRQGLTPLVEEFLDDYGKTAALQNLYAASDDVRKIETALADFRRHATTALRSK